MTLYNKAETIIAPRPLPSRTVQLAIASPVGELLRLNLTIDGKTEEFTIARHVAASMIGYVAKALAEN